MDATESLNQLINIEVKKGGGANFKQPLGHLARVKAHVKDLAKINIHLFTLFLKTYLNTSASTST